MSTLHHIDPEYLNKDGTAIETIIVPRTGNHIVIKALDDTRLMILGGEAMDGPRHIWWNFVSSSKERIEQAKNDWLDGKFETVAGDDEFIPLPQP